MNFHPNFDSRPIAKELRSILSRCGNKSYPTPGRRLRIGYMSTNFRAHTIGFLLGWAPAEDVANTRHLYASWLTEPLSATV